MSYRRKGNCSRRKDEPLEKVNSLWNETINKISQGTDIDASKLSALSDMPLQHLKLQFNEIEAHLLLLGGHLSLAGCIGGSDFQSNALNEQLIQDMRFAFCKIISKTLNKTDSTLSVNGFRELISLVLQWSEQCLEVSRLNTLTIATVNAISSILSSFRQSVADRTQKSLTLVLSTAINKCRSYSHGSIFPKDSRVLEPVFSLSLASSDALHHLFSSRAGILPANISEALEVIINFLQSCQVVEDTIASKMYASLIRTITTLISEDMNVYISKVASLMELVPQFLQYGVKNSLILSSLYSESTSGFSSDGTDSGSSRYFPPHQRHSPKSPNYTSTSSCSFSGSETSMSSSSGSYHDRCRSSRVRLATLSLIQKMCQTDGSSLHQYWPQLLPVRKPLQRSPTTPHLINVLLYDPHHQVRIASAGTISTLMEGRSQKGYISLAELPAQSTLAVRGFTSLSFTLGQIVVSIHEGLLYGIENETNWVVLPSLFRCLSSLISSTPYDRMPSDLRLRVVKSIRKKWSLVHGSDGIDVSVETSALIALRTVFGTVSSDSQILDYLSLSNSVILERTKLSQQVDEFMNRTGSHEGYYSLLDELLSVAYSDKPIVKSEALSALTSAAVKYHSLFQDRWMDMKRILTRNIQQIPLEHSSPEEKASQQAIRFLGAQLILKPDTPEKKKHLEIAAELVPVHLISSISHPSPVIRSATLSELGGASKELLEFLPEIVFQSAINGALNLALNDSVAAVRSAACRMIGDLVNFGFFIDDKILFDKIVYALRDCLKSKTISVKISSSWCLANVADAIALSNANSDLPGHLIPRTSIAQAAIEASKDHEKVKANGIRALGHLLKKSDSIEATLEWLPDAVSSLKENLESGGAKVKWNACYAIGSLASNTKLRDKVMLDDEYMLSSLIQLLVHLINENPNYKVQMQAASALDNFTEKKFFKDRFFSAITAVARRLHLLRDGSRLSLLSNDMESNGCSEQQEQLIQPILDPSLANFKYHEALKTQLEVTLLHLLSLLDGPFFDMCPFPKPNVLFVWLKEKVYSEESLHLETREQFLVVIENLVKFERGRQDWNDLKTKVVIS